MITVACKRWLFTRDFNYKALTGKLLVFWIGGRSWDGVAHEGSAVFQSWYNSYSALYYMWRGLTVWDLPNKSNKDRHNSLWFVYDIRFRYKKSWYMCMMGFIYCWSYDHWLLGTAWQPWLPVWYCFISYSVSVFSLTESLRFILEISTTYRLVCYLLADN